MSPTTAERERSAGVFPSANEMTSVAPAWPTCALLRRAISRRETNVMETSASRTRSALSTAVAICLTRASEIGTRWPFAATSTMSVTASSRFRRRGCRLRGCRHLTRRAVLAAPFARAGLDAPKLGRDPTARRRVVDARVIHAREHPGELLLHCLELRLRDRRFAQLSLVDALADDALHHLANALRRGIIQNPRGCLGAVSEHHDRGLDALRRRARVRELRRVRRRAVALLCLLEEIGDGTRAVVFADEWDDASRKLVLLGQLESFHDMVADDRRAGRRLELVVRVTALRLVLDEVLGLLQLADVVIERTDPREQPVRADRIGGALGEVRDGDRVRVRARRFEREAAQQRPVEVGPFEQREVRVDAGKLFGARNQHHRD